VDTSSASTCFRQACEPTILSELLKRRELGPEDVQLGTDSYLRTGRRYAYFYLRDAGEIRGWVSMQRRFDKVALLRMPHRDLGVSQETLVSLVSYCLTFAQRQKVRTVLISACTEGARSSLSDSGCQLIEQFSCFEHDVGGLKGNVRGPSSRFRE
jgi:hypothetical protein